MINYGVIGVGGYARVWLQALDRLEQQGTARVAAAVVRAPERYSAEVARLRQQGCAIFASLEEMLASARVDILGVPTGIATHAPLAISALNAGLPVLVEKPLCGTIQEAHRIREAEQASGRWCAVGYQWLHSPTIQWLRALVRQGVLGRISQIRTVIGWPRAGAYYTRNAWAGRLRVGDTWVLDGPATNATAHFLMNMLYLAAAQEGDPIGIHSVRAELYRANDIESYDTSCLEIATQSGALLYHYVSHALDESIEPEMVMDCEHATVRWLSATDSATVAWHDGRESTYTNPNPEDTKRLPLQNAANTVAAGRDARPLCGTAEALQQVLAINLAFESSAGIRAITPSLVHAQDSAEETLVTVEGMGEVLVRAYTHGGLFSDLYVPWARATVPVQAQGYARFPQNPAAVA
jgi:predicted dehydrogenase